MQKKVIVHGLLINFALNEEVYLEVRVFHLQALW